MSTRATAPLFLQSNQRYKFKPSHHSFLVPSAKGVLSSFRNQALETSSSHVYFDSTLQHATHPWRPCAQHSLPPTERNIHRNSAHGPDLQGARKRLSAKLPLHGQQCLLHARRADVLASSRIRADPDRHDGGGTGMFERPGTAGS